MLPVRKTSFVVATIDASVNGGSLGPPWRKQKRKTTQPWRGPSETDYRKNCALNLPSLAFCTMVQAPHLLSLSFSLSGALKLNESWSLTCLWITHNIALLYLLESNGSTCSKAYAENRYVNSNYR